MNDDDYLEIEMIIYELIYEYIENNVILMSKPYFHEMLSEDMITTYLSLIEDVAFFKDEEIHEDLIWFIEYLCDEYFEIFEKKRVRVIFYFSRRIRSKKKSVL